MRMSNPVDEDAGSVTARFKSTTRRRTVYGERRTISLGDGRVSSVRVNICMLTLNSHHISVYLYIQPISEGPTLKRY